MNNRVFKIKRASSDRYSPDYSINQCSLMVRVNGDETEIPLNFGLTPDEIKRLYPFILQFASTYIKNPSVEFGDDELKGKYADYTEDEMDAVLVKIREQSRYWYDRSEASVLDIALRFALDIKLRGIAELEELFKPISPLERIAVQKVEPLSAEETEQVIKDMGLETDVDHEHDPGDEVDVPIGVAGSINVDIYGHAGDNEYMSDMLDEMESKQSVRDRFQEIINDKHDINRNKQHSEDVMSHMKDGIIDMYGTDDSHDIFDDVFGNDVESHDDEPDDFEEPDAGFDMYEPESEPDQFDFDSQDSDDDIDPDLDDDIDNDDDGNNDSWM